MGGILCPVHGIRAGRRLETVVSLLDVAPTLLDFAGAESLPASRGRSLAARLAGETAGQTPGTAFAETFARGQRPARMIRAGRWKLNLYHGWDTAQLFDLETDPEERRDLGEAPEYAAVRDELRTRVTRTWDGDRVEQRSAERLAEAALMRRARTATGENVAERWPFPTGGNRREPE